MQKLEPSLSFFLSFFFFRSLFVYINFLSMIKPYLVCKNDTNKQEREREIFFRKITKMKH